MAGSQLKRLKATLKANGLTGQTNIKKKGKSKAPSDTRRDDKEKVIQGIREEFNPFEIKVNRQKYDIPNKKVPVARPGISKQIGEDERKAAWEARKARHNKVGGLVDRRFGEHNTDMTPEERMLARFTRERQNESSKGSMFNLEDDDTDMLTHYGKSLSAKDSDLMISDDDDEATFSQKKRQYHETMDEEKPVKKTKAEVMKEVMAKSKFHKHERQLQHERNEAKMFDLNDEFDDVMAELNGVPQPKKPMFSQRSDKDREYDLQVKQLSLEKRAAPADRTKTEEELADERTKKMKELEDARMRRMEGLTNYDDEGEAKAADADDLDDEFWAGSDENEEDGFVIRDSDAEQEDSETEDEDRPKDFSGPNIMKIGDRVVSTGTATKNVPTLCPATHAEFLASLKDVDFAKQPRYVAKILDIYRPNLAEGNKAKIAVFGAVLIDHILYLADNETSQNEALPQVLEQLIAQLRGMSDVYNEALCEAFRSKTDAIHVRLKESQISGDTSVYPLVSDLVFYSLVGSIYSTSDHYHLVVTPSLILMAEHLEQGKVRTLQDVFAGLYIADLFLHYQRLSKRYSPEVTSFLERALLFLVPDATKIDVAGLQSVAEVSASPFCLAKKDKVVRGETLRLTQLYEYEVTVELKSALLLKTLALIDTACTVWREKTAFIEIVSSFVVLLKHLLKYQAHVPEVLVLLEKLLKLSKFSQDTHKPLTLQSHRPLAIATYVPKFEENFNPDKKSYDPDRERQEIGKLKAQLKKERKITIREIRKDTKFTARQQIKEKKADNDAYHAKMKHIYNSVSTVEGAAKNEYEREKKLRKNKR
ncbi:hypothetical protein BABINDRAFT_162718 [Babjeviella inositovora NRRL Y-12698]|uniref:Nop14-like protein n=1 Tax=Babjeviella inositovora NRRL Y-12698 TaxID=984486 RepID=A0A1E3QLF3_9ASCO|nr:uncharacterized protein BABINDRAFT_162718 [Babjeviella inositovora NRRL Y-12698]ODQ78513.1 hypothetical protein BABINDRAFT_162718 [Babjeviella inositovora NRRL Y-12698]